MSYQDNLPPLNNVADVNGLGGPDATAYLTSYQLQIPNLVQDRKELIRREIGCMVDLRFDEALLGSQKIK